MFWEKGYTSTTLQARLVKSEQTTMNPAQINKEKHCDLTHRIIKSLTVKEKERKRI